MSTGKLTREIIDNITAQIQRLYLEDTIPWVVGYSGGKDSSATLQLVWYAISKLPVESRHKTIHVISTDTLVESPVMSMWVILSHEKIKAAADEQQMPIVPHRLTPEIKDSFWVNLIGKGYPAPRITFRWCTSRLKIQPSNIFITNVVATHGEAIVVLGTRKAESANRASNMSFYENKRMRDGLSPNASLPNSLIFTPIEDWSDDNVWTFLMQYPNPWGFSNKELLTMYRGATADNDCPLVVDSSTPSCGNSRFGCWVCTLVSEDKSMKAMIQNDSEKSWMTPMLELRNELGKTDSSGKINDRDKRDFRKMHGNILLHNGQAVHGPYTKVWREYWLTRLLEVEIEVQQKGPEEFRKIKLISDDELREIRRIWVLNKHEFDDSLPRIYEKVTGNSYNYLNDIYRKPLGHDEWNLLKEICEGDELFFQLQTSLLDIEQQNYGYSVRKGLLDQLQNEIKKAFYTDEEDALEYKKQRENQKIELEKQLDFDHLLLSSYE
ncbi:DNA phosphorothioation system sulfurtransferase DndC [Cohnella faecalis]|uniref:DNA phosphorothioation system sulfurtransferase DndC n=1 Tax=Cohnella faecalis TaxID=2315694 RepID=A0A398CHQ1_9BACL|nr:DNA phosphorothioation system sulfurtransferase DndC [Cohnella faecalis]RIE01532.1 DNA phosphorothioation system sulfurtransferase DndC [Cohnella faecalis]